MDTTPSCAIVPRFIDSLFTLVDESRSHWRSFGEFWKLFEGFVKIGERERQFFNMRRGCLILVDCYLGDASPGKQGYPGKVRENGGFFFFFLFFCFLNSFSS